MKRIYHLVLVIGFALITVGTWAQKSFSITDSVTVGVEASGTASTGEFAPLLLSANTYNLVSPYANSAYERVFLKRPIGADSLKNWKMGYGLDVQFNQNSQSSLYIHQLYAEVGYKKLTLSLGSKERPIDLRNNSLTSGGLSLGINARPIPEALLTIDYFSIPFTKQWWKMYLRAGYGAVLDGDWQKSWVADTQTMHYTSNVLFHEKALYWKFGREELFPLTFNLGVQMMTQFGGTAYNLNGFKELTYPSDLRAFWDALIPMGTADQLDGEERNAAGNTVGSFNMRLTYHGRDLDYTDFVEKWSASIYFERLFEDASQMTPQYGVYDHLLGLEVALPKNPYVSNIVVEHLSTIDQAGPIFHDASVNMPEQYAGRDDYYNHTFYTGWQHYGMGMGHPLLMSPIYNSDHQLYFKSNRMEAWHFGLSGSPVEGVSWRLLASVTEDRGTYDFPLSDIVRQHHLLLECGYAPKWAKGWSGKLRLATSRGKLIGNTSGAQLAIRKTFAL